MITLDTLNDWYPLGGSIVLRAGREDRARLVRLYLNCMEPTPLFIVSYTAGEDGSPVKAPARFLCTMPAGLEQLEFYAAGDIEIGADHADRVVYYQSTEGERHWFDGDGESFTMIHERAPRNEALEWVQFQAEQNQKRMQAALRAEMETQLAAIRSEYEGRTGIHGGEVEEPAKPAKRASKAAANGKSQSGPVEPAPSGDNADEPADGEAQK
ncbi:hypothetical protein [Mesorhizobium comanense]|uniref:hypothetical protein n=1 Tax=Mesorhizobium comanense TaxID=2502215 RepID=UPI0010F774C8|nr:hypothetical protein [Mesorhizobium comanense]DAV95931.1 MAG TPA: hypothetical protein [Microviridae sp.]